MDAEWERFADPLDQADQVTQSHMDDAISHAAHLSAPEQMPVLNADGVLVWPVTECVDCGDEIEEGRLALGKVRCLRCQTRLEKRRAGYFTAQ